jgi:gluconokinase
MPHVPGLRSPYAKVGRLVYFGRLLDKIRLHAAGRLPADYQANLGDARPNLFDSRCCRFLNVHHADLSARAMAGGTDEEILTWCHEQGGARTDEECMIWNRYMTKLGWHDDRAEFLAQRVREAGLADKPVQTFFDLLDYDEGRDPAAGQSWLQV